MRLFKSLLKKDLIKIFEDAARRSCTREDVANMADRLVFKGDQGTSRGMNSIRAVLKFDDFEIVIANIQLLITKTNYEK